MKRALLILMILFSSRIIASDIIPKPKKYITNGQFFTLTPDVKILYGPNLSKLANYLGQLISPATGWDFTTQLLGDKIQSESINISIDSTKGIEKEGYILTVTKNNIKITGSSASGVVYGIQTLMQMLPPEIYNKQRQKNMDWTILGATIEDAPEYTWRGMMLDLSRYFFNKDYVLHFIDMMAMYKMNVLHLHLVDDSGWRIEIKKYPKLTSVGAWRGKGLERTGGYYTQDDMKEIIAYATLRNIDIIPEIEVPAHALSAIASYPYLSCTEKFKKVQMQHSISSDIYCVGKETTFTFLEDIFEEISLIFPSKYIHIGGDEANYEQWESCKHCQKRKKDLVLKNETELQYYFTNRIQQMVKKHGKTIVGWDEILVGKPEEKAVGMVWYNTKRGISEAINSGHNLVMALTDYCYFDAPESNIPGEVKAATWIPSISLEKVYSFNLNYKEFNNKYNSRILGGHATLWSDQFILGTTLQEIPYINENRSEKYFDYLTFPRMAALSEVCWTSANFKSWNDFQNRMKTHYNRYDYAEFGYRVPQPKLVSNKKTNNGSIITLENVVEGAEIRYSIDGTIPNIYSTIYTEPVTVQHIFKLQAITVVNGHQFSLPLSIFANNDNFKNEGEVVAEWKPVLINEKEFASFEISPTNKINGNGYYELSFVQTAGSNKLEIESIEVFKDREKIAEDIHRGYTGKESKNNTYLFEVTDYSVESLFIIYAKVRSSLGKNSYGTIFIKRKGI